MTVNLIALIQPPNDKNHVNTFSQYLTVSFVAIASKIAYICSTKDNGIGGFTNKVLDSECVIT